MKTTGQHPVNIRSTTYHSDRSTSPVNNSPLKGEREKTKDKAEKGSPMSVSAGSQTEQGSQEGGAEGLQALRADFATVRAWMVEYEEWTPAQADEIGQGIRAAVEANDLGDLAFWRAWMANMSQIAASHRARMLELERQAAEWVMAVRRAA